MGDNVVRPITSSVHGTYGVLLSSGDEVAATKLRRRSCGKEVAAKKLRQGFA
jgi:hypothetical protein